MSGPGLSSAGVDVNDPAYIDAQLAAMNAQLPGQGGLSQAVPAPPQPSEAAKNSAAQALESAYYNSGPQDLGMAMAEPVGTGPAPTYELDPIAGQAIGSPGAVGQIVPMRSPPIAEQMAERPVVIGPPSPSRGATAAIGPFAKGGIWDPTAPKRATYHIGKKGEKVWDTGDEAMLPPPGDVGTKTVSLDRAAPVPPSATSAATSAPASTYGGEIDDYTPAAAPTPKVVFAPKRDALDAAKEDLAGSGFVGKDLRPAATEYADRDDYSAPNKEAIESGQKARLPASMKAATAGADVPALGQRKEPTTQERLSGRFHDEPWLAQQRGLGEMDVARKQAEGTEKQAQAYDKMTDEDLQRELDRKKRDQALMEEDERTSLAARDFQVDPGRYMHNASFFQKALMLIGGAAGGVARGINGGRNSVIDGMNAMIDRDIEQQKGQYQQLRQRGIDIHNQWSMNARKDENEDAQRAIMKAQILRATEAHTLSQVQKAGIVGPQAAAIAQTANKLGEQADMFELQAEQAKALAAMGKNDDKAWQANVKLYFDNGGTNAREAVEFANQTTRTGGKVAGGEPVVVPGKHGKVSEKQQEEARHAQDALDGLNNLIAIREKAGRGPSTDMKDRKLAGAEAARVKRAMAGNSRASKELFNLIGAQFGDADAATGFDVFGADMATLQSAKAVAERHVAELGGMPNSFTPASH